MSWMGGQWDQGWSNGTENEEEQTIPKFTDSLRVVKQREPIKLSTEWQAFREEDDEEEEGEYEIKWDEFAASSNLAQTTAPFGSDSQGGGRVRGGGGDGSKIEPKGEPNCHGEGGSDSDVDDDDSEPGIMTREGDPESVNDRVCPCGYIRNWWQNQCDCGTGMYWPVETGECVDCMVPCKGYLRPRGRWGAAKMWKRKTARVRFVRRYCVRETERRAGKEGIRAARAALDIAEEWEASGMKPITDAERDREEKTGKRLSGLQANTERKIG